MLITVTYLEQTDPADLIPARTPKDPVEIWRVEEISPEFARFLYASVGGDWYERERLDADGPPPGPWPGAERPPQLS